MSKQRGARPRRQHAARRVLELLLLGERAVGRVGRLLDRLRALRFARPPAGRAGPGGFRV
jgi:hypothetical protein